MRENLTQRHTDYRDTADSVVLAKRWLEGEMSTVKSLDSTKGGYPTHKNKEIYWKLSKKTIIIMNK